MRAIVKRISRYAITNEPPLFVRKTLIYVAATILGMAAFYLYSQSGRLLIMDFSPWSLFVMFYHRIGLVFLGLFPLTIYLIFLIAQDVLHNTGHALIRPASRRGYYLLLFAAPNLGLMGTFISLGNALAGMDISQGLQHALQNLGSDIGQALDSTKYGICLAVTTYPFLLFINRQKSENRDDEV